VNVLAPGLPPLIAQRTHALLPFMLPMTATIALSAFFAAVLAAFQVPMTTESSLLVSRTCAIGYAVSIGVTYSVSDVAYGLLLGSTLATCLTWLLFRKATGIRFRPHLFLRDADLSAILKQGASLLVATAVVQLAWAYTRRVATLDAVGTNAALTYVFSLTSIGTVLLGKPISFSQGPHLARLIATGQNGPARRLVLRTAVVSLAISSLISLFLTAYSEPLIRILYSGGAFGDEAVASTATIFRYFVWGIPASVVLYVLMIPLMSLESKHTFSLIVFAGYIVHFVLTVALFPLYGKLGMSIAYLIGANLQALCAILAICIQLSTSDDSVAHMSIDSSLSSLKVRNANV
jgi:putative peptidoglycan lipid II flippase